MYVGVCLSWKGIPEMVDINGKKGHKAAGMSIKIKTITRS